MSLSQEQGWSHILKQVPQNFINVYKVDDVTLRKISIASEKIINYRVTSSSNHYWQICILAGERIRISVVICCFLFVRQELVHANVFCTWRFVYKNITVRSLDYLNRRKVLCVYVDMTVLIWQKVNEAFHSQNLSVKS